MTRIECADCGASVVTDGPASIDARLFMLEHYRVTIDPNFYAHTGRLDPAKRYIALPPTWARITLEFLVVFVLTYALIRVLEAWL